MNFVEIEDAHNRLPAEWKDKFSEVDWSETLFLCPSINDASYDTYEITSDDEIFGRSESNELTKLTDFTAKLELSTGVILKEEDYELDIIAYFLHGDLIQLKLENAKFVDREERIKYQKEFESQIDDLKKKVAKDEAKSNSTVYKIWKSIISVPLTVIRYVLGFFIKVCFFIEDLLT
tara:strand:+ start:527 stop:1057 length:531 start_codon:yes stop_codon:yes gene_type:complete